jgi:putative hydrolase of the HAD superfamily
MPYFYKISDMISPNGKYDMKWIKKVLFTLNEFEINDFNLAKSLDAEYLKILPLQTKLFDDAIDVLEYLFPKYQMHIITNGFLEVQTKKLKNSNLQKYFCELITSEEANANKPQIEIFDFAFEFVPSYFSEY